MSSLVPEEAQLWKATAPEHRKRWGFRGSCRPCWITEGIADQRIRGSADQGISGSADQQIDQWIRGSCAPCPPGTRACYAHTCTDSFDRRIDYSMPQYTCMASGCRIIQHLSQGLQVTSTERVHWLVGWFSGRVTHGPWRLSGLVLLTVCFTHARLRPPRPDDDNHMADKTKCACPLAQKKEVHFGSAVAAVLYPPSVDQL